VLVSRSGRVKYADQGLEDRLERLRASGAEVVIEQCDMGVESEVEAMLVRVRTEHGPLRIVVHAAGVLADGLLEKQDAESMRRVFAPKADGAWFLHRHSKLEYLDSFILLSSISSLLGNAGQLNYSAANSFLDELAQWRIAQGLPTKSIRLPGVAGIGMAAAMDEGSALSSDVMIVSDTVRYVLFQALDSQKIAGVSTVVCSGHFDSNGSSLVRKSVNVSFPVAHGCVFLCYITFLCPFVLRTDEPARIRIFKQGWVPCACIPARIFD